MKIYFDNVENLFEPNCKQLSTNGNNDYWLTASGSRLKEELRDLKLNYFKLSELDEPGIYFIEVNGDPIWWSGIAPGEGVPAIHILKNLPNNIIELVRQKKLRIIISADREGGTMIFNDRDCFMATYQAIRDLDIPPKSVLIIQGNKKIEEQYKEWLSQKQLEDLYDVKYSNHFNRIFTRDNFLSDPIVLKSISNPSSKDYNSLNRTYKNHRSAHLYYIAKLNIVDIGLVSANELRYNQKNALEILNDSIEMSEYDSVLTKHYPRYIDGDWSIKNAANSVNLNIFVDSLISFVTETKFEEDVVFLTEKVYKALTYGHPMIVLGPRGTLQALRDLGYKTDWCGIDPSYNDIEDHTERFYKTHEVLLNWIKLSRDEKINLIKQSLPTLEHNIKLSASRNFYHEDLIDTINISRKYFND